MSVAARHPGGAPVARLDGLPPLERRVIRCLRLWYAGPEGEPAVRWEIGRDGAGELARRFGELLDLTAGSARRPMLRHDVDCPCAGADECVFARFVALAAEGAREDAVLMAALMVRPDMALPLATLAEAIGLELARNVGPRITR